MTMVNLRTLFEVHVYYYISREKFEPGQLNGRAPGQRSGGPSSSLGSGSNFSLEM